MSAKRLDAKQIRELLRDRVADVAAYLFPNGKRERNHWRVGSIDGESGYSFDICLDGDKAGMWGDFADSERASRNLLDLWMRARNVDFKTALREAAEWLGEPSSQQHTKSSKAKAKPKPFAWQGCVLATTREHIAEIAKWRGFKPEFVRELRDKRQIGIYKGLVAFPAENDGVIVGVHYRLKDGNWRHAPQGIVKAAPMIFGKLIAGEPVHFFESTWDALAFIDKTGERSGIVCTRGAHNGKFAAVIPERCTVYAWKQNDELKNGKRAGDDWLKSVCEHAHKSCTIKLAEIPAHDLNDWTRDGATSDDLLNAIKNAETVRDIAAISLDDFYAYMPMHVYIFIPARDFWPASSVNARIPPVPLMRNDKPVFDEAGKQKYIGASAWLDANRPVEQMTWAPGLPMLVENRLISDGGWIERHGCRTFNLYRPPNIALGDANKAGMWLDHVAALYPNDAEHIVQWCAHRVQRPYEKINHALFLGGSQGIGKDTILYPVKRAVGMWNVQEILPPTLLGRFNGFVKAVLLCINEVHDLGDLDRFGLYERLKAYTAAPPDVIRVDEKNLREYPVLNVCGVLLTSNHKTSGLYLPSDDRRHYVAWSDADKSRFTDEYWRDIYAWYDREGCSHVAAYLAQLDLSAFNPKSPPLKTDAFWEIVESNRAPENAELADALDRLGNPAVVTKEQVVTVVSTEFASWLNDRRNARQIPYRFEEVGYIAVRNPDNKSEGRWVVGQRRCVIYAKRALSIRIQVSAARKLIDEERRD